MAEENEIEEFWTEELEMEEEEPPKKGYTGYIAKKTDAQLEMDVSEPSDLWKDFEDEIQREKVVVNKAIMKEVSRRRNMVRVLKFLVQNSGEPCYATEIARALDMCNRTVVHALKKLLKANIIQQVVPHQIDRAKKYYQIVDLDVATKIISRYHWLASFKLAKLLPYSDILRVNDLKENTDFLDLCKKYFLSVEEALEALRLNRRKVESVYIGSNIDNRELVGFRRRE